MRILIAALICMVSVFAEAANPSIKTFRGIGGIILTTNETTGFVTIDGSGISSPTGGVSAAMATNIAQAAASDRQYGEGILTNLSAQFTNVLNLNVSSNLLVTLSNVPNNTLINLAAGSYHVIASIPSSNQLAAINIFSKNNIRIRGAGMGITTIYATNVGSLFQFTNINGLVFQDLTVRGWVLTNYALKADCFLFGAMEFFDCRNVLVETCEFVNHHDHGLLDSGGAYGIASQTGPYSTNNFKVRHCQFSNIGSWISLNCLPSEHDGTACPGGGWTTEYCHFDGCMRAFEPYGVGAQVLYNSIIRGNTVRNTIEHGLTTAGNTNSHGTIIEDNLFIWDKGYTRRGTNPLPSAAILINGGQRHVIRNNWIVNPPAHGIKFDGSTDQFGSVIENNYVYGQLYGVGGGPGGSALYDYGHGLDFYNSDVGVYNFRNFTIRNNKFEGMGGAGIQLAVMRDSEVTGNELINCGTNAYFAFQAYTTAGHVISNVLIARNIITTNSASAGPVATGFLIQAHVRQVTMSENTVAGPATPISNASGSEVIFLDQLNYVTGNIQNDKTNVFTALRLAGQGTNVLLQVSAGSNVTAVTIGSGLTMTAGTLAATGVGGNLVTNPNQFGASTTLTLKTGAFQTNANFHGSGTNTGNWIVGGALNAASLQNSTYAGGFAIKSSGNSLIESTTTDTELSFLNGVTSPIQAQLSNDVRVAAGANITVTPSGSGGIMTYTVAGTGGGVTNLTGLYDVDISGPAAYDVLTWDVPSGMWTNRSPFFQITFNVTNINVGLSPEQVATITTNASFRFFLTGTPLNGEVVKYAVSNYSASVIFATNTTGIYDTTVASNVTVFAIPANSIKWFEFISLTNMNLGVQRWQTRTMLGKEAELAVAGSLSLHTNVANSVVTISNSTASVPNIMVQTNFVLNQIYTNIDSTVLVSAQAFISAAAVNGNCSVDLMWSPSGGSGWAKLAGASMSTLLTGLTTTVSNTVAGVITNLGSYYFTNSSTGAGNSAGLVSGTGQITYLAGATGATGASGQITNAPPYTIPITGTNFIIDWLALGATNSIILTNYANAGILNTNVSFGNGYLRVKIIQGSQGFRTIVPNTNHFGPNWRYTTVHTQIIQSTNGNYHDFMVLVPDTTNAVLSGQNWGAAP